ncbi:hypothetical protein J3A83DRAFT_4258017 [Scleroderma citrinum]
MSERWARYTRLLFASARSVLGCTCAPYTCYDYLISFYLASDDHRESHVLSDLFPSSRQYVPTLPIYFRRIYISMHLTASIG